MDNEEMLLSLLTKFLSAQEEGLLSTSMIVAVEDFVPMIEVCKVLNMRPYVFPLGFKAIWIDETVEPQKVQYEFLNDDGCEICHYAYVVFEWDKEQERFDEYETVFYDADELDIIYELDEDYEDDDSSQDEEDFNDDNGDD